MAQYIQQPSIFGRIGTGIGKGLAEQLPEEVTRGRLAQGLQNLSQQQGLTPFQQFSRLAAIPGVTPQMIQSGSELLRQQGIRQAYKRGQFPNTDVTARPLDVQFSNLPENSSRNMSQQPEIFPSNISQQNGQTVPSNLPRVKEAYENPPAASENPLNQKYVPVSPWNQGRQEAAINEAFDRGIATTFPEAQAYANSQREIYERTPEEYRKQLDYKKAIDKEVDDRFDKQLETRLQKEGKDTFKDIPGDLQLNITKKARNSVATGKMTPDQAAEYYSKKALDLAKDKSQALKIANRDVVDRLLPHKKEEVLKNLMHIAKNYTDMGSDHDFYTFLKTDQIDENGKQIGMGLSPGGAAIIQYPRTPKVKELIKNTRISHINSSQNTRAFAQNIMKVITPEDSFLAIARQMKQQDPFFDEYAFFDYLRENRDQYGSIPRLDREVSNGVSDFFPNWRDIGLFPAFGKAVSND